MWFPAGDRGDRGVSSLARRDIHAHCLEVPSITVDGLGLRGVVFVKMDVDGGERAALLGAAELLRRDRPAVLVELESSARSHPPSACWRNWGTRGGCWRGRWITLDGFDLVARQARTEHLVHRGLLRRAFLPHRERYLNSVLFLPDGRTPGAS